ncbi:YoaK family protein [Nesterenkonia flava]|uniref:YoaK family protein n=1 Tax=Nesterenkonia flava TaxID=469799 RepID=A0ABU1FX64_9MICC|nr:YoaK family protein [Nesterenkonia flava]MDR5712743.1 YoaK family protein [Nesterenkonia flava]
MATDLTRRQLGLACAITAAAGFVDGIGFLHLGGYFVSFMSGNSTRAAADLASGDLLGWGKAIGLVAAFVFGVVLASLVTSKPHPSVAATTTPQRSPRHSPLGPQLHAIWLSVGILVLASACATASLMGVQPAEYAVAPLIAASMGAVNSTFTRGGEVSVGLTYMTGALVKAAQLFAARLKGAPQTGWLRYAALWVAIAAGSAAGAVSYLAAGLVVLWAAPAMLALCAGLVWRRRRL